MKKSTINVTSFLLMAIAAAFFVSRPAVALADGHAYVGESKCEDCHDSQHEKLAIIGPDGTKSDPVSVWMKDPHHSAFDSLTSDWGKLASQKASVADPQADGSMCLTCHAPARAATIRRTRARECHAKRVMALRRTMCRETNTARLAMIRRRCRRQWRSV